MIKAATITLGLTLLLASATAARAQAPTSDPAQQAAVDQAVHNEHNRLLLRQKLTDARRAEERRELVSAAKLYDEAWELVQSVGRDNVQAEAAQVRTGLSAVRMELAAAAKRRNDLEDAKLQVNDVLRVDRTNAEAQAFKRENDKLLVEQIGRHPSLDVQRQVPGILTNKATAGTLVHDGMLLYQMGKLNEAQIKLHEAAKLDPQNQAAYYYLNLVAEARYHDALNQREIGSRERAQDVEREWALPTEGQALPQPNPFSRSTLFNTGKGRQAIYAKLGRIRLDEVKYEGLPLSEVVISLNDQAKKRDPEKRGINFIINPNIDAGAGAPAGPTAIDPATGLPVAPTAAPSEGVDISTASVKLSPALNDVSLAEALDAIIKVANIPIKYSVEDYAVVFSHRGAETPQLYTRQYKIDPNTFVQGLQGVSSFIFGATSTGQGSTGGGGGGFGGGGGGGGGSIGGGGGGGIGGGQQISGAIIPRVDVAGGGNTGGGGLGQTGGGGGGGVQFVTKTNLTVSVSEMARAYFTALGVDLGVPKSVFFNERKGELFVRATMQDLDTIEEAIHVLNTVPDQINIKAKFVEVAQNDTKSMGFEWMLGNVLMNKGSIGLQGGSAPSFAGAPSTANPAGVFPGNTAAGTTLAPANTDQTLANGLRGMNPANSLFTLTGILTDPQFRVVLHALDQRDGSDVLAAPEVTTISGRQAQMKATEIKTVIVDFSFNQAVGGIGGGGGGFPSDRNIKQDFAQVDAQDVLAKVAALPITEWSYTAEGATRHIGPMAQDFRAAFQLGNDEKRIAVVDAAGVALAAIKGLNEKNQKLEEQVKMASAQMKAKDNELQALKQRLDKLEQILNRLGK